MNNIQRLFIQMFIPFDWLEYQLFAIVSKFVSAELNNIWVQDDKIIFSKFWGIWFLWYCVKSRWQKTLVPRNLIIIKINIYKTISRLKKKHYFQTLVYILRVMDLFSMAVFQQHREQERGFYIWGHETFYYIIFMVIIMV